MEIAGFQTRRADSSDVEAIAAAHRDSILSIGAAFYPPNVVADWQAGISRGLYLEAMERGEVFFIATGVREEGPIVLGFASDYPIEGTKHGTSVYVRGSAARRGIGSALLRMAEAHGVRNGARSIEIEASLAGVEFYRANGFVETGQGEIRLRTGRTIGCVFMRKDLAEAMGATTKSAASAGVHEPFIEDAKHIQELDRQRFVVVRPSTVVSNCYRQVQETLRQRLSGLPVSYPARAHVTLAGFAAGTSLQSVQDLVSDWVRQVPPLGIEVERATSFGSPFQIPILQVVKAPALFDAMASLRRESERRGLATSTITPVENWVFHMSLAYCAELDAARWKEVERFVGTLQPCSASCVQDTVELVAFDAGTEYSGGVFSLARSSDRRR
jgi:ribosomal protein S18 acetylase RimI-like enzyme/2'-5' RNA ligase